MSRWEARGRLLANGRTPAVMGILNVTPDSFSDGGETLSVEHAFARALAMVEDGADLLDIGGESSRPGASPISLEEELQRVIPVVAALAPRVPIPISVDTTKAEVARQALAAGASIVNDITALSADPAIERVVRDAGAGVVLMHMRGEPRTMQNDPLYDDVVREVRDYLSRRIEWAEARGIPRSRIAVDPGVGFGKTATHNLELLRNLEQFATLGCTLLVGLSRKGFLGGMTGRPVGQRAAASVAASLAACVQGANVVRVHDVGPMADAIKVWTAIRGWN
ncbi:MAG: dihydropteroate synthase [Isosphaeraceae bacterium]|nr:dihydropteroate synthase [Isosphaeraceae bacterium]